MFPLTIKYTGGGRLGLESGHRILVNLKALIYPIKMHTTKNTNNLPLANHADISNNICYIKSNTIYKDTSPLSFTLIIVAIIFLNYNNTKYQTWFTHHKKQPLICDKSSIIDCK